MPRLPRMIDDHWRSRLDALDPERDHGEIARILSLYEFPWDINQALSFALFRTYAVPTIGGLLDRTSEFGDRAQQRYDDTGLLLEAPLVHGFASPEARTAVRRINQMHRRYDISGDDMRYVLSTFVVTPKRWLDRFGWRRLTDGEVYATVRYYDDLGHHLGIRDLPEGYAGYERLMDDYEAEHFAFTPANRRVADATLHLMTTFRPHVPARLSNVAARALMEPHLLAAFGYDDPGPRVRATVAAGLRARSRALRLVPSRRTPQHVADLPQVRSYPHGYDLGALGTFAGGAPGTAATEHPAAPGCPVAHHS